MDNVSYALGLTIGQQLLGMGGKELNIDDFAAAIKDVLAGRDPLVKPAEAQRLVQAFLPNRKPSSKLPWLKKERLPG